MRAIPNTEQLSHLVLLGYAKLKGGKISEVKALLDTITPLIQNLNSPVIDQAGWLWLYGEYVQKSKDKASLKQNDEYITMFINRIVESWQTPQRHWIQDSCMEMDVYLSQTAYYYAALRSVGFLRVSDLALMTMKQMRDFLFIHFMDDINMVSSQNGHDVSIDMVLATVPFGFFTPGDLAFIKALDRIDEMKLDGKASTWFSWYYSECGNLVKARALLEQAKQLLEPNNLWLHAAEEIISVYDYSESLVFEHLPSGYESPYFYGVNERYPREPLIDDEVAVQVIVRGKEKVVSMQLQYHISGEDVQYVEMNKVDQVQGEAYYIGKIPPSHQLSRIEYAFLALTEAGQEKISLLYEYSTLQWVQLHTIGMTIDRTQEHYYYEAKHGQFYGRLTKHKDVLSSENYCFNSISLNDVLNARDIKSNPSIEQTLPNLSVLLNSEGQVVKVKFAYKLIEDTVWFGMGERFAKLSFQSCELDNYVYNQYKDQGFRTYIPIPLAIGSTGEGLFLQSSLYSLFKFEKDKLEVIADTLLSGCSLTWFRLKGMPVEQLRQYSSIVGKPKLPPRWAFGPWMSSNNWDSEKETYYQLNQNKKYNIPATVIVLEQWSDEATFYIFNDAQYEEKSGQECFTYSDFKFPLWGRWPNPKAIVQRIHDDGMKLLLWQAPVMKYMEGVAHIQRDADAEYMLEKGFEVKQGDNTPYQIPSFEWFRGSYVPDFTSPEAAQWWFEKRQYLLDEIGIDGFKTDGGECIYGKNLRFFDGRTGAEMRNEYPNTYIGAFHKFADQHVHGGAITFSRAGYIGAQLVPMHWAGDEKSTFEAFQASIRAGLSAGLSGISFWGWDFGGFSGEIPTAELYIRGMQMATFCPVMQYHAESKGQFNLDRTPWNIAERTGEEQVLVLYKYYADLRMNLLPYIYFEAIYSTLTGEPLMRAHILDYPDDTEAVKQELQYKFGRSLLVAPITIAGATQIKMYFPKGDWMSLFDNHADSISGGRYVEMQAELHTIPVFIQENSIIPVHVNEHLQLGSHVGNRWESYERLMFIAYITAYLSYEYKDDDAHLSINIGYEKRKLHIHYEWHSKSVGYLCLRHISPQLVLNCNQKTLKKVSSELELTSGCYLVRNNEIIIVLTQGSQNIST